MSSHPARLKPISPVGLCVTTKRSTNSSLRKLLLDGSDCPTISAARSLPCWRTIIFGSPVSESKPPAACSSETGESELLNQDLALPSDKSLPRAKRHESRGAGDKK